MCYTMGMTESRLTAISNTALAFMGDAVHSFYVRNALIEKHDFKSAELAKREAAFVSAKAQAKMLDSLLPLLTEEEASVVRRGQNTKTNNKPKNAAWSEYRKATAYEALLGWLYLLGRTQRLREILEKTNREDD